MAPLLAKKRVLGAAREAAVGTAETLAAGDAAFNVFDAQIQPTTEWIKRAGQSAFSQLAGVPGPESGTATFRTELHASGVEAEPKPVWATTFLPACGFIDSADDDTMELSSTAPADGETDAAVRTLTIGAYIDGVYKAIKGAMGNPVFNFEAGQIAGVDWTFHGVWIDPADVAILTPDYPAIAPLRFVSSGLSIAGAWAPVVNKLSIDLGNVVTLREDSTKAEGYVSAIITGRDITGTMDPEMALVATKDLHNEWLTAVEQSLGLTLNGGAGNTIAFAAPKMQFTNLQEAEREGVLTEDLSFQLNRDADAGDDELTITFS